MTTVVSIHAPWEGCDAITTTDTRQWKRFNSRTLGRVRPLSIFFKRSEIRFNSRTLGRVRPRLGLLIVHFCPVSIHAPWEGCDLQAMALQLRLSCFNSRTLGRVRLNANGELSPQSEFQFTHPGKGATRIERVEIPPKEVSIHAPWEGCDGQEAEGVKAVLTVSIHAPWEGCDHFRERPLYW